MPASDSLNDSAACHNGNGANQKIAPCACCAALAQVRMPWLETMAPAGSEATSKADTARQKRKISFFDLFSVRAKGAKAAKQQDGKNEEHEQLDWDEELLGPRPRKLWQGLDGITVCLFGIVVPALMFGATCLSMPKRISLVLINHPLETLAELLLLAMPPIINYVVWSALCKNKFNYSKASSAGLGAAAASMSMVAAVCIAGLFAGGEQMLSGSGTDFAAGFSWLAFLSALAAAVSAFIIYRVRAGREFATTKRQVLVFSSIGALLALSTVALAEARPWYVRYAEHLAVSSDKAEAKSGLALLRQLYPERELHMECADARAAGLSGLFIPMKPGAQRNLYFAITGKPYSFHETNNVDLSSMPDDYVKSNIVGDEIKGLSLARSSMESAVHPRTMSANIVWTLVFKNDTALSQEARTEIALPPGAVVNDVIAWNKGEMRSASFFASGKVSGVSGNAYGDSSSAATVSDLGHGRVLMRAYPVPQEGEYKVAISIVAPLKAESNDAGSLRLPGFVASNFKLAGDHQVAVHAPTKLGTTIKSLATSTSGGEYSLSGAVLADDLKSGSHEITIGRPDTVETIAVLDRIATKMAREERLRLIAQRKEENKNKLEEIDRLRDLRNDVAEFADAAKTASDQIDDLRRSLHTNSLPAIKPYYDIVSVDRVSASAPKHLVVVIDGSATTAEYIEQIHAALSKLPQNVPTSVIVASAESEKLANPVPLNKALEVLKSVPFIGGQDNLGAVVSAAELAGKTPGGAVLWFHGPQPATSQKIYIISQYVKTPAFYELTLGSGDTDTVSLFCNNPEVGPFEEIPRHAKNLESDLSAFFACWKPENSTYSVNIAQTDNKPANIAKLSKQEENEVLWLWANQQCQELLLAKQVNTAATIAAKYGFVSPVSYAAISTTSNAVSVDADAGLNQSPDAYELTGAHSYGTSKCSAPLLQGATNGTIGPQADAVVIQGVNTAGTVRVNNLANLEALLNIIANLGEVVLAVGGAILIICGLIEGDATVELMGQEIEVTRSQRLLAGATMIIFGLFTPAVINYFISSARDANLFS